jgi:hypothetical protein
MGTEETMIAGRVIMLSRDQGLASIVGEFVGHGQPLTRFSSPTDVPDWLRPPTGAVVLDYPKAARAIVYLQLRQRYQGPVLAVLDPDEDTSGLPTDHGRIGTLQRPFTGEELSASLDALAGSRNGARRPKSRELTAPPLGTDAAATAPLDVSAVFAATPASLRGRLVAGGSGAMTPAVARAWAPTTAPARAEIAPAAVGVPATRIAGRVAVARRPRGLAWRRMGPASRRRVNSLVLSLAASAALVLGAALGDGGGCRPAGCADVARAIESRAGGVAPVSPGPATPRPAAQPATGSGNGAAIKGPGAPRAADPSPGPSMVIPIASGVNDLISGTSSSSGGAPLLVVAPGPAAGGSGTGGSGTGGSGSGGGGSSGGGVPSPTTRPPATTSPVTTAGPVTTTGPPTTPPTTAPPATLPPTTNPPPTDPPTTSPPPTDPPTTLPPTTEPLPTVPPTTAGAQ